MAVKVLADMAKKVDDEEEKAFRQLEIKYEKLY